MAFVNTIDVLGDEVVTDSIISRTITEFKDDRVNRVRSCAFAYCTALTLVDLPNITTIGLQAFYGCTALRSLILRKTTLVTLESYNAIATGQGYIYVPAALVDSYKTNGVWKTYASQFRALEDYTVDGTITGELDETKI